MKYAKEKLRGKNIANISEQSCIEDAVLRPVVVRDVSVREGKLEKAFGTPELPSLYSTCAHQKLI